MGVLAGLQVLESADSAQASGADGSASVESVGTEGSASVEDARV